MGRVHWERAEVRQLGGALSTISCEGPRGWEDKAQRNDTDAWLEQAEVRRLGKPGRPSFIKGHGEGGRWVWWGAKG